MYKQTIGLVAAALMMTVSLGAQSKTVTGKEVSTTATIEGIEQGSRQLYVKRADGTNDVVYVPETIKRFSSLKVGQTITATISAIDPQLPRVSFTGPRGWNYTTRVEDKALLSKFKVGDKVDITWTEAMLVSVEDAK